MTEVTLATTMRTFGWATLGNPRSVLHYNGAIYVVWLENTSNDLKLSYSTDNGSTWNHTTITSSINAKNVGSALTVWGSTFYVFYYKGSGFYYKTGTQQGDKTVSWGSEQTLYGSAHSSASAGFVTSITTNRLYVLAEQYNGSAYCCYVWYSTGGSFSNILTDASVIGGGGYGFGIDMIDDPDYADDGIMVCYAKHANTVIYYKRYNGSSWTSNMTTGYTKTSSNYCRVALTRVGSNIYCAHGDYVLNKPLYLGWWNGSAWQTRQTVFNMTSDRTLCIGLLDNDSNKVLIYFAPQVSTHGYVYEWDIEEEGFTELLHDTDYHGACSHVFLDSDTNKVCRVWRASDGTVPYDINFADDVDQWTIRYWFRVQSSPVTGIAFTVNGSPQTTNYEERFDENTSITVVVTETEPYESGGHKYWWDKWDNDSTSKTRQITLTADTTWTMTWYKGYQLSIGCALKSISIEVDDVSQTTPFSDEYERNTVVKIEFLETEPMIISGWRSYFFNGWDNGESAYTIYVTMSSDGISVNALTVERYQTNYTGSVTLNHLMKVTMPDLATIGGKTYKWQYWEDNGNTNRIRTVTITGATALTAVYVETGGAPVGKTPTVKHGIVHRAHIEELLTKGVLGFPKIIETESRGKAGIPKILKITVRANAGVPTIEVTESPKAKAGIPSDEEKETRGNAGQPYPSTIFSGAPDVWEAVKHIKQRVLTLRESLAVSQERNDEFEVSQKSLEEQITLKENEIRIANSDKEKLENRFKDTILAKDKRLTSVTKERDEATKRLEKQIEQSKEVLRIKDEELSELLEQRGQLDTTLGEREQELSELKTKLETTNNQISELKTQLENVKEATHEKELTEKKRLETKINSLQIAHNLLKAKVENETERLRKLKKLSDSYV